MPNDQSRPGEGVAPAVPERLSVRVPVAMELTGLTRSKLYELIKSGELPIIKIGATTLIPMESLRHLLASHQR